MFKRKKWRYLILDEAHMIKNWKSQRWQVRCGACYPHAHAHVLCARCVICARMLRAHLPAAGCRVSAWLWRQVRANPVHAAQSTHLPAPFRTPLDRRCSTSTPSAACSSRGRRCRWGTRGNAPSQSQLHLLGTK